MGGMDYWLTTHQPHPVPDDVPWHIYFRGPPGVTPAIGDRVLFYETYEPAPGRDRYGAKSMVCAAEVAGVLKGMTKIDPWVLQVPCGNHRHGVTVPLADVRDIVPGPFYRRTLTPLNEKQFRKLVGLMKLAT
jgi:hypothetical protein